MTYSTVCAICAEWLGTPPLVVAITETVVVPAGVPGVTARGGGGGVSTPPNPFSAQSPISNLGLPGAEATCSIGKQIPEIVGA
jgi:hypothetical protein